MDIFKCLDCSFSTQWKCLIQEHIEKHNSSHSYKYFNCISRLDDFNCFLCKNYRTNSFNKIKKHIETEHRNKSHKNKKCNNKTTFLNKFECIECSVIFKKKVNLMAHISRKHSKKDQIFACYVCKYKTWHKPYLLKHIQNTHKTSSLFTCPHCNFITKRTDTLKSHINRVHISEDQIRWIYCQQCNFKAKAQDSLRGHILRNHNKSEILKCPHCLVYTTHCKAYLRRHIEKNHLETYEIKWFYCYQCDYKIQCKQSLAYHILIKHTGEDQKVDKWHKCLKCQYKTLRKGSLKNHYNRKHNSNIKKSKKCEKCEYKCVSSSDLKRHHFIKHTEPNQIKWYRCGKCEYQFKIKQNLKRHKTYVHKIDYECSICHQEKSFTLKELKIHIIQYHKLENEIKLKYCNNCSFKTKTRASITQHLNYYCPNFSVRKYIQKKR